MTAADAAATEEDFMLELKNISYEVEEQDSNIAILRDINLIIEDKFVAVTGPNGGGKTNLLQALACLISNIVRPVAELEKNRKNMIFQHSITCQPFLLDEESKNEPTEFQVYFRHSGNEYRYYLSILSGEIVAESLYWKAVGGRRTGTVFEREGSEITLGASIKKSGINKLVNPKMPYLSFLAINYDLTVIADVMRWFESCIIRSYANPMAEMRIMVSDEYSLWMRKIPRAALFMHLMTWI